MIDLEKSLAEAEQAYNQLLEQRQRELEFSQSSQRLFDTNLAAFDKYYPQLQPKTVLDFSQPLQLLAAELSFIDPLSGEKRQFRSRRQLAGWPENAKE